MLIRDWVEEAFGGPEPTLILELGANTGQDTRWMAEIPGVQIHAFEPEPRCPPPHWLPTNVTWHRCAVAAHDGEVGLIQSLKNKGRPHTASSSIKRPTWHLRAMPWVTFAQAPITVSCTTLDTFADEHGVGDVDLLWADVQGAEPDVIRGGPRVLARTRHAYLECPKRPEYEGQLALDELMLLLPGWRVVHRFPYDVLLENTLWER